MRLELRRRRLCKRSLTSWLLLEQGLELEQQLLACSPTSLRHRNRSSNLRCCRHSSSNRCCFRNRSSSSHSHSCSRNHSWLGNRSSLRNRSYDGDRRSHHGCHNNHARKRGSNSHRKNHRGCRSLARRQEHSKQHGHRSCRCCRPRRRWRCKERPTRPPSKRYVASSSQSPFVYAYPALTSAGRRTLDQRRV